MTEPIVSVEWLDTAQEGGWRTMEENAARTPDQIVSVGFLIADDDTRLVLLQSRQIEGELGADTTVIPRRAVLSVTLLAPHDSHANCDGDDACHDDDPDE